MTKEDLARLLDHRLIGDEITREEEAAARAAGLVVVFGASDDNMEFRGAINDEVSCFDGGEAFINADGLLIECESKCAYYEEAKRTARKIEAHWCKAPPLAWTYSTDIPHATFTITEDGDPWCQGIVFEMPR